MKKFLASVFLFVPCGLLIYVLLVVLWGSYAPGRLKKNLNYAIGAYGHMYTRLREAKDVKNVDVLFLGSSHCYRGFDTRIFKEHGLNSFNLGSSGQSPVQTKILVERYLESLKPELIVFEVYPGIFENDGVESSLDLIANDIIDSRSLKMALQLNNIKTYNTLMYAYYRQLFHKNASFSEDLVKGEDTYISGGFVERKLEFYHPPDSHNEGVIEWHPEKLQLKAFEEIVHLANEKGMKLFLVQAPVVKATFNTHRDNQRIDNYFSNKAEYYNFNYLIKMNDSLDFYDHHHLNQNGVRKFNTELLRYLKKQNTIVLN